MPKGKVKFFNGNRGFGFITPDDGSEAVFVHSDKLTNVMGQTLVEGMLVEYDVVQGPKGPMADNVTITDTK
ncbi:cold-shock protein [Pandoraea norimbergensis]|uniref:Cold-shock protein n=1 Tax=Pandoraea norimbergensis TaxID=93219 RepID=A0ABM5WNT9_9BURK|nr:cold shock domain-containing protein [Pandoraea norimbergensis]ALS62203.1 cold-shock protein [Pandoraea norimbergensis]